MEKIFITYCREDSLFAKALRNRLKEEGFSTWVDLDQLQASQDWRDEIDVAIREAAALIVVVTPESSLSPYVTYEWAYASGAGIGVVPLLLRPTEWMHPRLASWHHLNFTDPDNYPWPALIDALRLIVSARQLYTVPVPAKAPAVIRNAVAALDRLDPQEQVEAVKRLGAMEHDTVADTLAGATQHPVIEVRTEAAKQLAMRKDPRAVPKLIEAWRNGRRDLVERPSKFIALAAGIGADALSGFLTAAKDEDANVRRFAIVVLVQIGHDAAIPTLMEALRDPDTDVREAAARGLGEIAAAGPPTTMVHTPALHGELLKLLADSEEDVRKAAVFALGKWSVRNASDDLVRCLREDTRPVSAAAARALGELHAPGPGPEHIVNYLIEALSFVPEEAAESLGKLGDRRAVPYLLSMIREEKYLNAHVQSPIAMALGRLSEADLVPEIAKGLRSEDLHVRLAAICAMGEMGEVAVRELCVFVEDRNQDSLDRSEAVKALQRIGTPEALRVVKLWERYGAGIGPTPPSVMGSATEPGDPRASR